MRRGFWPVKKIISGGQTGVDRAALDVARALYIEHGGWCPRGRRAEDGVIPPEYNLEEASSDEYPLRTEWNVRDSDGTLILTRGRPQGGTALTINIARRLGKPRLVIDMEKSPTRAEVRRWVEAEEIRILNVAGPRESGRPGTYQEAKALLRRLLERGDA